MHTLFAVLDALCVAWMCCLACFTPAVPKWRKILCFMWALVMYTALGLNIADVIHGKW